MTKFTRNGLIGLGFLLLTSVSAKADLSRSELKGFAWHTGLQAGVASSLSIESQYVQLKFLRCLIAQPYACYRAILGAYNRMDRAINSDGGTEEHFDRIKNNSQLMEALYESLGTLDEVRLLGSGARGIHAQTISMLAQMYLKNLEQVAQAHDISVELLQQKLDALLDKRLEDITGSAR